MQIRQRILTHLYASFILFSRQNLQTFDISHAFLPLTIAKLSTFKNVRFLLAHPVSISIFEADDDAGDVFRRQTRWLLRGWRLLLARRSLWWSTWVTTVDALYSALLMATSVMTTSLSLAFRTTLITSVSYFGFLLRGLITKTSDDNHSFRLDSLENTYLM